VLSVDDAGTVGTLRVETGDQEGENVIILSGLNPGDRIITDGVQKAAPGATVQVVGK
jgi:multidrug efflux pump subunit AcrA (membrane-fusion protein)